MKREPLAWSTSGPNPCNTAAPSPPRNSSANLQPFAPSAPKPCPKATSLPWPTSPASKPPSAPPNCHPLPLNHVGITFQIRKDRIEVACTAETDSRTGVEMEALTGASIAALTLYDMCKAMDKTMRIEGIQVLEKIKS